MEYLVAMTTLLLALYDVTAVLPSVRYDVTEESATSTIVGNIMTDAGLSDTLGPEVVKDLRFRINDDAMEELFTIDDVTGIIQVKKVLDREVICPGPLMDSMCVLNFDVAATRSNPDFYDVVAVTVNILDVNDNIPIFPTKVHHIVIQESASPPVAYNLPLAKDADTDDNGIKSYSLKSHSDIFELKVIESAGTIRAVQLILIEEVDRETKSSYEVSLQANDGGSAPGLLLVNISISDANDHVPKFARDSYVIYIAEDIPVSSTLLRVQATDEDIGINSQITYSLAAASERYGEQFHVDENTGDIILIKSLDYEVVPVYNLIIQAEDGGANSQQAYCDVMINVSDVNDQAPVITINTLAGRDRAEVLESAEPGQFVAHVSVKDLDTGAGGNFSCNSDNDQFILQKSSAHRFDLLTAAKLDREQQESITVEVICSDKGSPILTSSKQLIVSVQDSNDNTPMFNQRSYTHEIDENNMIDATLFKIQATDADMGRNAEISYIIDGDDRVKIDELSGLIQANSVFNYESERELIFVVKAQDHGPTPLSSTVTLTLYIRDVNDEAPNFSEDSYNFRITENQIKDSEVGRVSATDADSYPFNEVFYTLAQDSDTFHIDQESGIIKTLLPLDRESQGHYTIEVIASNAYSVPPLSSTATVSIEVTNVNDNAPVIDFPAIGNNTVVISNLFPEGLMITQVKGHDDDLENEGQGQNLHFKIITGNDKEYFQINRESGIIVADRSLEHIDLLTFELKISVSDGSQPPLGTERLLKIVVDKSVPYEGKKMLVGSNLLVVVILSASSAIIVLVLLAVIVFLKRRDMKKKKDKLESSRYTIDFERSEESHVDLNVISRIMSQSGHPNIAYANGAPRRNDAGSRIEGRGSISSYPQPHQTDSDNSRHTNSWPRGQQQRMDQTVQQNESSAKPLQQLTVLQCYDQRHRTLSDHDNDSAYSGELSNSDSGRGHSLDYHDCSYGYGSYIERPVTSHQDNGDVNVGYFNNKPMIIPQTISQMIKNNGRPRTTMAIISNNGPTHNAMGPMVQNKASLHPTWNDTSFTDSVQSLDSGPDDDSSSTSGSYVIDLCDFEEEEVYVPHPVTV